MLSEHANITMLFTSKDKNTLVAKPLFQLTTSKRPIDYSKWPLPNIHYDCHLSTMQPLRCRGRPNQHQVESSRWNWEKTCRQWQHVTDNYKKKKTCFCAWNRNITNKNVKHFLCVQTATLREHYKWCDCGICYSARQENRVDLSSSNRRTGDSNRIGQGKRTVLRVVQLFQWNQTNTQLCISINCHREFELPANLLFQAAKLTLHLIAYCIRHLVSAK